MSLKHWLQFGSSVGVFLLSSGAYAQSASTSAHAEPDPSGVDAAEITVTARRVNERLRDVPVSVTALGGDTVERLNLKDVSDLRRAVPSVALGGSVKGGSVPYLTIRGIGTNDTVSTFDPTVGIYINDVVQQRANGVLSTFYDIQSVQVVRGPQGTLFGRNTIAGAILINTRPPEADFGGYAKVGYGNFDYKTAEGALNIPVNSVLQFRLAGKINRRDGYMKSDFTGQRQSDLHDEGARISMRLDSDPIKIDTVFSYYNENSTGLGATSPGLYPPGPIGSGIVIAANNNVADAGNRALIAQAGAYSQAHFYRNLDNEIQFNKIRSYDVSNTINYQLSDNIVLKNIFGFRDVDTDASFDADGTAARQVGVRTPNHFTQYTNETQLQGRYDKVNFILGAYYFEETGNDGTLSYFSIPLAQRNAPAAQIYTHGDVRNRAYSVFGSLTYELAEGLKVTGGARWTKDIRWLNLHSSTILNPLSANPTEVCSLGTVTSFSPGTGPNGENVYTTVPANPCNLELNKASSEPTYSVDVSYKINDDVMVYAAHRKGYKTGGWDFRQVFNIGVFTGAERLKDVEVGAKTKFNLAGMPTTFNIAGYYGWYTGIQRSTSLPNIILNGTLRTFGNAVNAAKGHTYGVEVEYGIEPVRGLNLSGYVSYNNAGYDEFLDPGFNPPLDRSKERFGLAPRLTLGATLAYTTELGSIGQAVAQLNYFHTSSFNGSTSNDVFYSGIPGYDLLNARLELNKIGGSSFDLSLFANNIADKKYFTSAQPVPQIGYAQRIVGAPRMVGIELRYRFGADAQR
jgi:iron complex outermembrane receptor protein